MSLIYIIFLILICFSNTQNNSTFFEEEEDEFENDFNITNECGPFNPLEPEIYNNSFLLKQCNSDLMNNKSNIENSSNKCCLLTGVFQLKDKAVCVSLSNVNNSDERISKIKEYENKGITKLKLQCFPGEKRKMVSTCNENVIPSVENCYKKEGNKECCYVSLDNDQEACRWFDKNMDNDIRSEAIMAAKTIGVKLKIECSANTYKFNSILFLALFFFIL